jgi:lipoate-protein ligase A
MDDGQRTTHKRTLAVLPYAEADGPANMASDEAMLEAAGRGESAYLRCYSWSVPTLSLGYFQRIDPVRTDPRWRGVPLVRRPTGGGAIWHHHELTYAIAIPPGFPHGRPNTALYVAVHGAIAAALEGRGVPAGRAGDRPREHLSGPDRPFLCFTDRNAEDIVSNGHKVVGSAQRRRGGAVLQHGSLLLARSPEVAELLGVSDVAEVPESPRDWIDPLVRGIAAALDLQPAPIDWPPSLRERSLELERSTYRNPAWLQAR